MLRKLLALFSAKLIFKAWQHTLTLAVSAVSVHLMHFVCLRRKFTVCWLNMSKCSIASPVLVVTPTSLAWLPMHKIQKSKHYSKNMLYKCKGPHLVLQNISSF